MSTRAKAVEGTRLAIVDAARALFGERSYDDVTLPAVAERAGVTVQTLLRRFGSKEQLFATAAGERSKEIRADREAAAPGDVGELIAHYERWGEQQLHLLAQETRVPVIRAATDAARSYHRARTVAAFDALLGELPEPARRRRIAQLTAVTDLAMWRVLRHELGLDQHETTAAVRELVEACLRAGDAG